MSHRPRTMFASLAAAATTAALLLSACGPGPAEKADGQVTLQMVESLTNPTRTTLLKKLIADFEEQNPGIKVQLISPPTDQADQKIQQMLQSGKGVDVLEVRDTTVGPCSTNGWLYDMTPDLKGWDGWQALTPNALKVAQEGGKSYFVPYGFYGLCLFYRKDLVQQAGFSGPPKSWDGPARAGEADQQPVEERRTATRSAADSTPTATRSRSSRLRRRRDRPRQRVQADQRQDDLLRAEGGRRPEPYLDLFKSASPPSSVSWGYPEMVAGLLQRLDGLPAAGPRGDRDRQAVQVDQGGPVGHRAAAGRPDRQGRPAAGDRRAGVSPRAASTRPRP